MSFSPTPEVSIAMPVFNSEHTVSAAIKSILLQTLTDWELILIDDGSSDSTASVCQSFTDQRIIFVADGRNLGLAARLNQAIDLSRGRYLARMDGDDVCFPERLEKQIACMKENADVDLVGTGALVFDDRGAIKGVFPLRQTHAKICRAPWAGFYLPHPTWMGKIEWFKRFRYSLHAFRAEDQDLLLRSYDSSKFACLPDILLGYRQNAVPIKNTLAGRYSFARAIVREALRKKRYWHIPLAATGQIAKGGFEAAAISLRLERVLLKHRALPFSDHETLGKWRQCWHDCTA